MSQRSSLTFALVIPVCKQWLLYHSILSERWLVSFPPWFSGSSYSSFSLYKGYLCTLYLSGQENWLFFFPLSFLHCYFAPFVHSSPPTWQGALWKDHHLVPFKTSSLNSWYLQREKTAVKDLGGWDPSNCLPMVLCSGLRYTIELLRLSNYCASAEPG